MNVCLSGWIASDEVELDRLGRWNRAGQDDTHQSACGIFPFFNLPSILWLKRTHFERFRKFDLNAHGFLPDVEPIESLPNRPCDSNKMASYFIMKST
jgi:hypothetical protein